MSTENVPSQSHCPGCGKPLDRLRAGAVAVFETRMVYYCSTQCKNAHLRGENGARTPTPSPASRPAEPPSGQVRQPAKPAKIGAAAAQRSPALTPAPELPARSSPPAQAAETAAPPSIERAPEVQRESAPHEIEGEPPRASSKSDPARRPARTGAGRRQLLMFIGALIVLALSGSAPTFAQRPLSHHLQLALAALSVVALLLTTVHTLRRCGWRAALEEWLVTCGAALTLLAGLSPGSMAGALLAAPGIAAVTWLGRWLEAVLRWQLVERLRPLHSADGVERSRLEATLFGDSPTESKATRGWAEPAGSEPLGPPPEPKREDLLPQIAATRGEGASPLGRSTRRAAMIVGVLALPLGLLILLALVFWATEQDVALILSASFVLALTPRGLRRGWVGPLLTAAGLGARRRLLFRDGAALEATARAQWVLFDAQGTLTFGSPEVTEVIRVGSLPEDELLALAAGVEQAAGDDALGQAIICAARDRDRSPVNVRLARRTPGLGMSATCPDGDLLVGTRQLILGQGISVAEADIVAAELESRAENVVFVALAGRIQGVIGLQDRLRPGAEGVASAIASLGVEPVLMTGESHLTAEALGKKLGFEHIRSEVAPDQWAAQVRSMRETGAGIAVVARPPRHEDTLAAADVGLTLGGTGLEIEAAGVALRGDEPTLAVQAVSLARGAFRTARINLSTAVVLLVIWPGLASLLVNLLPTPWAVPMIVALVSALTPALLCWDLITSPRGARER